MVRTSQAYKAVKSLIECETETIKQMVAKSKDINEIKYLQYGYTRYFTACFECILNICSEKEIHAIDKLRYEKYGEVLNVIELKRRNIKQMPYASHI